MELYGVQHGWYVELAGSRQDIEMEPSWEMIDRIGNLPAGSKVGIEAIPEVLSGEDLGGFNFSEASTNYWQPIVEKCADRGLELVYLDSLDLYKEIGDLIIASHQLRNGLREMNKLNHDQRREVEELIYSLEIATQFKMDVTREESIFHKLEQQKPDLAVVGLAHGDYLMLKPESSAIQVDEYWRGVTDEFNIGLHNIFMASHSVINQRIEQSSPDPDVLTDRDIIDRKYSAVTKGRILPESEPEWIGSWTPNCRPKGLFEVYPDHQNNDITTGSIEDTLGSASFNGTFTDEEISFEKKYDHTKLVSKEAYPTPLEYWATRSSENGFQGNFGAPEFGGTLRSFGKFIIESGSKLYTPVPVEDLDISGFLKT